MASKKQSKDQISLGFFDEPVVPEEKPKEQRWKVKNSMEPIKAPWTEEQVLLLNRFQYAPNVHPFTCLKCADRKLVANVNGWTCPNCNYTQDWAMSLMMDIEFIERAENWHLKHTQQ